MTVFVGLGSNLGHSQYHLKDACTALSQLPDTRIVRVSSLYLSKPLAGMQQPDYFNAVAWLDTRLAPLALLDQLQLIETEHGRVRGERWGARTLDLDLLSYHRECWNTARLILPHPGLIEREFVVHPLAEIAAAINLPVYGSIRKLAQQTPWRGMQRLDSLI